MPLLSQGDHLQLFTGTSPLPSPEVITPALGRTMDCPHLSDGVKIDRLFVRHKIQAESIREY